MILLLLFSISSTIGASNVQKPKQPKNTLCACAYFSWAQSMNNAAEYCKKKFADFLVGSKYEKWCKFTRMLCNKISENPRKGFLQLLARGMNKIKKTNIFSNPTSLKLSFAPGHGMFHRKRCILGHPNIHATKKCNSPLLKLKKCQN